MAVARYYNGTDWVPVSGNPDGVRTPTNIEPGQGLVYRDGVWISEYQASQQALDDLREEFEGHHHDDRYAPYPRFKVGVYTASGGTGNKSVTGVGFRPGLVVFHSGYATTPSFVLSGSGAMDSSGGQWADAVNHNLAGGASVTVAPSTTLCMRLVNSAGTDFFAAAYVSMDADGFTFNVTTMDTSARVGWVAYR